MKFSVSVLLCTAVLFFAGCDDDQVRLTGSGNVVNDSRTPAEPFTGVDAEDAVDLTITQGATTAVIVTADDNVISEVLTTVRGNRLKVGLSPGSYNNVTLEVAVTVPSVDFLKLSDAVKGSMSGFTGLNDLEIQMSDASKLNLGGAADDLRLNISDASELEGFNFTAARCSVDVSDASKVKISATETLSGNLSDASELRYRGDADVNVSTSDASRVINEN